MHHQGARPDVLELVGDVDRQRIADQGGNDLGTERRTQQRGRLRR